MTVRLGCVSGIPSHLLIAPDRSKDGTVVGVSCVVQDITERIELETVSRPHRQA
ncbi:MAG: hypothetical protein IIC61_13825 [Proteobacteria bacterium]|nr:hypothetical protein [Pseudomonadota bacterium]